MYSDSFLFVTYFLGCLDNGGKNESQPVRKVKVFYSFMLSNTNINKAICEQDCESFKAIKGNTRLYKAKVILLIQKQGHSFLLTKEVINLTICTILYM